MINEDKQLLLIDLCGRLPYKTYIEIVDGDGNVHDEVELDVQHINTVRYDETTTIRPYLRYFTSMTEKERQEYEATCIDWYETLETYDWLNAHHFDYRGLIGRGLAIEVPEGMYKTE